MHAFKFELGSLVSIMCSKEFGVVIARAEYLHMEDNYLVRYKAADGRAVESWWGDSSLEFVAA